MAGLRYRVQRPRSCGLGGESLGLPWHAGSGFTALHLAPPLAQSAWVFAFGLVCLSALALSVGNSFGRSKVALLGNSGRLQVHEVPNPPLNSDPACIAFRSISTSRYLGFAQRLGSGGAG